jgi:phage-related baseplate assembly protein
MLTIRDFNTIVSSIVAYQTTLAPELTDYVRGAVARALDESFAAEIQREDFAIYQGVLEGIEVGTYQNFDFGRLPAVAASGLVRYTRTTAASAVTVPAGHRVQVPNTQKTYATTKAVTLAINEFTADIAVRAEVAGIVGNTPANTIVDVIDGLPFTVTVSNPSPFLSGLNQETEDARRERFRLFIAGLGRGTKEAIEFAARSAVVEDIAGTVIERVQSAKVREPFLEDETGQIGLVEVYIDNGSGTTSDDLKTAVAQLMRGFVETDGTVHKGWVAAGIDAQVIAAVAVALNVTGSVTVLSGFDPGVVRAAVTQAITTYIQSLKVFDQAIVAKLIGAAIGVSGVADITLTDPTTNVLVGFNQRLVPGVVTIS